MQKLLEATQIGNIEKVATLLKDCQTVDIQDDNKMTPLHWAVLNKSETIVKLLLEYGANSNLQDCEDRIPLHYAMEHTDTAIAELLMKTSNINAQAKGGQTPLHCAAFRENHDMMLLLLSHKAEIDAIDHQKKTSLHWAAINKNTLVIDILLTHKANVNAKDVADKTPLHWAANAALKGHSAAIMLTLLRYQPTLNTQDIDGKTALHYATQRENQSTIDALLAAGADTTLQDGEGETTLTWAAQHGDLRLIRSFIKHRVNVNAKSKNGMTPLHWLISRSSVEYSKALLDNGADANATNQEGRTPLYFLGERSRRQSIELLLGHGANINVQDNNGITLLHLSILKYYSRKADVTKIILEKKINVNAQDCSGKTALHLIATKANIDLLRLLLIPEPEPEIEVNIQDNEGKTALYYAILEGSKLEERKAFVDYFVEYGARIYISKQEQNDLDKYISKASETNEEGCSLYTIMLLSIAGMRSRGDDRFSTAASLSLKNKMEAMQRLLEDTVMNWLKSMIPIKNHETYFPTDNQEIWLRHITSNMLRALPHVIDVTEPVINNEKTSLSSIQHNTHYLFKAHAEQEHITKLVSEYQLPLAIAHSLFYECKKYRAQYIAFYKKLFSRRWTYSCPPPGVDIPINSL